MTRRYPTRAERMRAFDRLPAAARQALRDAANNIDAPPLARALRKHEVDEAEIIERIRKQDVERARRDEERREREMDDGDD
jgi:hypothetical protein